MNDLNLILLAQRARLTLKLILIYLTLAGTVTFSLFILEESFQTVMFGTWPAADAERWDIVLDGTRYMEKIEKISKIINYSCGWIQPLAFISYKSYADSMQYYIGSLKAKVLFNAPELMLGQRIEMAVTTKQFENWSGGFLISYRQMKIFVIGRPTRFLTVSGVVKNIEGMLVLDTTGQLQERITNGLPKAK